MITFRNLTRWSVFTPIAVLSVSAALSGQSPAAPAGPRPGAAASRAEPVDFVRDIVPILRNRCLSCHGPEEQEADLRLDTKSHTFPPDDEDVWTIIPGKPDESVVMERITLPADDPDIMPAEGDPLKPAEVDLVRRWIAGGAAWPTDYTIEPPARAKLPEDTPLLNGIDASVIAASDAVAESLRKDGVLAGTVAANSQALEVNYSLLGKTVDDARLDGLAGLEPRLVWLNLSNTAITSAGIAKLRSFVELRRLHLARTTLDDSAVDALLALPKLEYLNLYGTKLTDAGLSRLAEAKALRKLFVWQTQVTPAAVGTLRSQRPGLAIDDGHDARALLKFIAERKAKAAAESKAKEAKKKAAAERKGKGAPKKAGAKAKTKGAKKAVPKKGSAPSSKAKLAVAGSPPVNTICPVSDKAIDGAVTTVHEGQLVAFCCAKCRKAFLAAPTKFTGKLPRTQSAKRSGPAKAANAPQNTACPVSGKAVDPQVTTEHGGHTVAFCCGNCRQKFLADPTKFAAKLVKRAVK